MPLRECKKKGSYASKETADLVLGEIKKQAKRRRKKWRCIKRSYKCEICGSWHLTSQTLRHKK